jgi:hypothetical protein
MKIYRIEKFEPFYLGMTSCFMNEIFLSYKNAKKYRDQHYKDDESKCIAYHIVNQETVD